MKMTFEGGKETILSIRIGGQDVILSSVDSIESPTTGNPFWMIKYKDGTLLRTTEPITVKSRETGL